MASGHLNTLLMDVESLVTNLLSKTLVLSERLESMFPLKLIGDFGKYFKILASNEFPMF